MAMVNARDIRTIVLEQSYRAHVGHIGCHLSVADIVACIFTEMESADRFVLSKAHSALALYAALHLTGVLTQAELDSYCTSGSKIGVHPHPTTQGIVFAGGSLGMGLSVACGMALADKMRGSNALTYVLMSDAECQEGSVWEAALFAAQHELKNLRVFVDLNGQQALGYTSDILSCPETLSQKFAAFGWDVHEARGNNAQSLSRSLNFWSVLPVAIVARTKFGSGVSFMENAMPPYLWHYKPLSEIEYLEAMREVRAAAE